MRLGQVVAVFALLAGGPAQALAARRYNPTMLGLQDDKAWELQIRPGFSVPRGALADVAKHSFTLHASVERHVNSYLSLGLEVGDNVAHRFEGKDGTRGDFTSNVRIGIFQASTVMKLGFDIPIGYRSLRPYFLAGAGFYLENRNAGVVTFLPSGTQESVQAAKSHGHLGMNGGVGFTYRPAVRVRLGGETRIHYYNQSADLDGNGIAQDSVKYFTTAAVICWLF